MAAYNEVELFQDNTKTDYHSCAVPLLLNLSSAILHCKVSWFPTTKVKRQRIYTAVLITLRQDPMHGLFSGAGVPISVWLFGTRLITANEGAWSVPEVHDLVDEGMLGYPNPKAKTIASSYFLSQNRVRSVPHCFPSRCREPDQSIFVWPTNESWKGSGRRITTS